MESPPARLPATPSACTVVSTGRRQRRAAAAVAPKTPHVAVGWKPFFWWAMRAGPALMALPTRLITS